MVKFVFEIWSSLFLFTYIHLNKHVLVKTALFNAKIVDSST